MSNDRANRLRERRRQSKHGEASNESKPDKPSEPSKSDETDKPSESDEASVKDEQVGTYMYLPQMQKKELERVYGMLKTEYEYEFDEDFEKNRHFFPLVIQYGLDGLDGLDASEVRERLDKL